MASKAPGVKDYANMGPEAYSSDAVNTDYVATFLAPEIYRERRPSDTVSKNSLAAGAWTETVATNSSGNAAAYIFPFQPAVNIPTDLMAGSFMAVLNASSFTPDTGL
jgi:hypothetical protein